MVVGPRYEPVAVEVYEVADVGLAVVVVGNCSPSGTKTMVGGLYFLLPLEGTKYEEAVVVEGVVDPRPVFGMYTVPCSNISLSGVTINIL